MMATYVGCAESVPGFDKRRIATKLARLFFDLLEKRVRGNQSDLGLRTVALCQVFESDRVISGRIEFGRIFGSEGLCFCGVLAGGGHGGIVMGRRDEERSCDWQED